MQQQHQAQAGPHSMNPQQLHAMQQQALAQQQHQQQQNAQAQAQAQAAAAAAQANQAQSQNQAQQQAQPNSQAAPQPAPPQGPQQPTVQQQQQQAAAAMIQQQRQSQGDKLKGQSLMRLMQFGEHLSAFNSLSKPLQHYIDNGLQKQAAVDAKANEDMSYWHAFVDRFFSPKGVLHHKVWYTEDGAGGGASEKQYEMVYPALARYFYSHFESGIKNWQLITEGGSEKELPTGHYVQCQKSSFVYWFHNGLQVGQPWWTLE